MVWLRHLLENPVELTVIQINRLVTHRNWALNT